MAKAKILEIEGNILALLQKPLSSKDDLATLFCKLLGFQYVGRRLPASDARIWGEGEASRLASDSYFEILAEHGAVQSGGFAIIYGEISFSSLIIGRTLILQLRKTFPSALFILLDQKTLAQPQGAKVHLIHPKLASAAEPDQTTPRLILRRFRFGPGERYRTTAERLSALNLSNQPDLSTAEVTAFCEQAFNKEALTDEFFRKLNDHIGNIEADLRKFHGLVDRDAFREAQFLIERLIFLYFAQNRGWLDQQPDFLPKNFERFRPDKDGFGYYAEFLHLVFRNLSDSQYKMPGHCLPFLNGGLFDDDEFRPLTSILKIRNATFSALFDDLLEAYNFTVREDTPLSQEVAVDPEMLGKVFESIVLHAESAGEEFQAPDKRKATGSYYTPRIVVHFICRETLRLYLAGRVVELANTESRNTWASRISRLFREFESDDRLTEEQLKALRDVLVPDEARRCLEFLVNLRTLDPAVGSGAFPIGLLHELVWLKRIFETIANGYQDPVTGQGSLWTQKAKELFIEKSLFGVDIQQQAIEICRLRLWLSLLVDYELGVNPFEADRTAFTKAIDKISQLPNLDMNFRRGDSLHDHVCGHPVRLDSHASLYADDLEAIEEQGEKLLKAKSADYKRKLRLEILQRRLKLGQRVITDQIVTIEKKSANIADDWWGESTSDSERRRKIDEEVKRLKKALKQLEKDEVDFKRLRTRIYDKEFYRKLRRLEGAEMDGPQNFVWRLDFPHVLSSEGKGTMLGEFALVNQAQLQQEIVPTTLQVASGFDIIVGNPPFVTARNPEKRELYRERWPQVCFKEFQLVCPFFKLGFELLVPDGQMGLIVANAFAMRDFGKPLLEEFLPTVDLQKIVDCSGLMFPGHGTPTCITFIRKQKNSEGAAWKDVPVRISAVLSGGGDLKTLPEESPLWHALAGHHDDPGYRDKRIAVVDRPRSEVCKWPLVFDSSVDKTKQLLERETDPLSTLCESFGSMFDTHKDDAYFIRPDVARRAIISTKHLYPLITGDNIRDWQLLPCGYVLVPYDEHWTLLRENDKLNLFKYLLLFRKELGGRASFKGGSYDKNHLPWYQYHQMSVPKIMAPVFLAYPEIGTHAHFVVSAAGRLFTQTTPLLIPQNNHEGFQFLLSTILNSSAALLWLKSVSFKKREAEDAVNDTYFEFAGKKLQRLPIPSRITPRSDAQLNSVLRSLESFGRKTSEDGESLSKLSMKSLFELPEEAYFSWNVTLPGCIGRDDRLGQPFRSTQELRISLENIQQLREGLRGEMISQQEEIDWLVYVVYGLLPTNHSAVTTETNPGRLDQAQRPYRFWESSGGELTKAIALIPSDWPESRKQHWRARLSAIRDNEHIRGIEQPIYKRRWDEQWKVGNRWLAGPIAYAEEFADAFRWWVAEKAEWYLEKNVRGGPIELGTWTVALWKDSRIHAAWPVAAEKVHEVELFKFKQKENGSRSGPVLDASEEAFARYFKDLVSDESVPEGIPPAVPWDQLEKKMSIPARVKQIRGKLNVPRERFHESKEGEYIWAGLIWQDRRKGRTLDDIKV